MKTFWESMLLPALRGIYEQFINIVPNILAALVILLIGWLIAKALSGLTRRLLKRVKFNDMAERAGITSFLGNAGFRREPSRIVGTLIFWLLMFTFILSAANTLNLTMIAETIQSLVSFIPNIIAVVFIIVFGSLFARFLGRVTRGAAAEMGIDTADFLGKLVNNLILIMLVMIALNQLEIQSSVLEITFAAVLGAFALAVALTLGIGTKSIAQNIISGVYARKSFQVGQKVKVQGKEGEVVEIGAVNTKLQNGKSLLSIPNKILMEEIAECEEK